MNELEHETIFEKGVPNPFGEYFTGQSYLAMLTWRRCCKRNLRACLPEQLAHPSR